MIPLAPAETLGVVGQSRDNSLHSQINVNRKCYLWFLSYLRLLENTFNATGECAKDSFYMEVTAMGKQGNRCLFIFCEEGKT